MKTYIQKLLKLASIKRVRNRKRNTYSSAVRENVSYIRLRYYLTADVHDLLQVIRNKAKWRRVDYLFTDAELDRARRRAERQPEDLQD